MMRESWKLEAHLKSSQYVWFVIGVECMQLEA